MGGFFVPFFVVIKEWFKMERLFERNFIMKRS